jgi:tetratricopeptide (TPR) repeat protein
MATADLERDEAMNDRHPDRDQLERFLGEAISEEESQQIQLHLFTCSACEERLFALLPALHDAAAVEGKPEAAPETEYRGLLQRVLTDSRTGLESKGSRLARERAEAGIVLRELLATPVEHRSRLVEDHPRFHNWGLFELLVERARQEIFEEPQDAEKDLEVAVAIAGNLDRRRYGQGSVEAAQTRALAWLGNARRVRFDFRGAEEAFGLAEGHLRRSWLDPLDEALVLELKALLRRAQRRFAEALFMLDEAIVLYREVNESHLQGRALIAKGTVLQSSGELDSAAACLRQGLFLVDPAEDPRLVVVAHSNLILGLVDSGRHAEARSLIETVRPLWQQLGTAPDLLRLRWIEGRAASGLSRLAEAEAAFLEVRTAFLASEAAYDAALVSLDLAAVYARLGRPAETRRLAAELVPIFRSREIHREAIAALLFFQRAAEMEQVTLTVVEQVAAYLQKSRANPNLRFRPVSGQDEDRQPPPRQAERQAPSSGPVS